MVITLYTEKVIKDLRTISHREAASVTDPDARYRIEAGSEKMEEIKRCVSEAHARLLARCRRWLESNYETYGDNELLIPTAYNLELALSERRAVNNAEVLANLMHTFLVEYALTKFYSIVHQVELSNKHSLLAIEAGNNIDESLYTKRPPLV